VKLAWQVSGGGGGRSDDDPPPGAAGPATKPGRAQAAEIEDAARRAVGEFDPERVRSRRDLHRQVMPGRGEPVGQGPPALMCGAGHDSIRPDTGYCADLPLPARDVASHPVARSAI